MNQVIDSPSQRPPALKKSQRKSPFIYSGNLGPGTPGILPNSASSGSIAASDVSFLDEPVPAIPPFPIDHSVPSREEGPVHGQGNLNPTMSMASMESMMTRIIQASEERQRAHVDREHVKLTEIIVSQIQPLRTQIAHERTERQQ